MVVFMIVESVNLENYRNYESLSMEFISGINILYGDNAQGKTNVLESLTSFQKMMNLI